MSFGTENIFKKLQEFLKEHQDEFATPEEAVSFFMEQFNGAQATDGILEDINVSPEDKSMDLVEQSQYAKSEKHRRELLTEAITIWPNNLDAQALLIEGDLVSQIEQLRELEMKARIKWLKTDQVGWENHEERAYLRLKASYANFLQENGLLRDAEVLFEELYSLSEFDNQGTRYNLMSIYAQTYNWRKAEALYRQVANADEDDQMIVPFLVLAILLRKYDVAAELFEKLRAINPKLKLLFKHPMLPLEHILDSAARASYLPNSFESLSIALFGVLPLVIGSDYVYTWLSNEYKLKEDRKGQDEYGNSKIISFPDLENNDSGDYLDDFYEEDYEDDPLFGITGRQYQALVDKGLTTYEAFEEITIKEVLTIHLIGQATINQLLENDVIFKDQL